MGLEEGSRLLSSLRSAVEDKRISDADATLSQIKLLLTTFSSLPPLSTEPVASPTATEERMLARDALEQAMARAVLLSALKGDRSEFARHIAQVKPYFLEKEILMGLAPSPNRSLIFGLNLLCLLLENRLAEFHSELELLSEEERNDPCVLFSMKLDQFLMVGSYDHVLQARNHIPNKYYSYFLDSLLDAVREAIAECMSVAYSGMEVSSAQKMMMMNSPQEVKSFAEKNNLGWSIGTDHIAFTRPEAVERKSTIPNMRVISENLGYATELERIV